MWEEIRTPEGKLLFRINRKEQLVEGKKGEWVVTASLIGEEVKTERKRPKKKTDQQTQSTTKKQIPDEQDEHGFMPSNQKATSLSIFFDCLFVRAKMGSGKGTDKKEPEPSIETYVLQLLTNTFLPVSVMNTQLRNYIENY